MKTQIHRRWYWPPIAVLILGLLSIVMLIWTLWILDQRTAQSLAASRAINDLQNAAAYWHLWLEEHLSGDPFVDLDRDVRDNQDLSIRLASLLLRGGERDNGEAVHPLRELQLRSEAEALEATLIDFRTLSEGRLADPGAAGVGTPMDQEFDRKFQEVKTHAEELQRLEEEYLERDRARFRLRVAVTVIGWALIVIAAAAALWSRERRRQQAADTLRQREAELQQAQKMEAVGRLAGGIAHDVNNYLGAIRGYCEVAVLKNESGEALKQRMTAAVGTADKVSALIRQLLAFSRKQPVQPEVVDLNRVVADLELLMERLLGENVALTYRLLDGLWSIEIDPSQIEQTLVNLLVNSRDAMPTGGAITIETRNIETDKAFLDRHPAAAAGRYVRLAVRDNGCGIPPEVQKEIFDPFFTTKAESGSSGLGLATVYAVVVDQNGGFLHVESQENEGTRFEIYLPASDQQAEPSHAPDAQDVERTGRVRVLLVEDNEEMRASTRELLEFLGHDVSVASHGEEALAILGDDSRSFDLLITDVIMPGLSGKELYDRVRERHGEIRCLFISGYTDNIMLRHGVEQDRVHFLQKPFGFEDLARKISEVLADVAAPVG